MAAAALCGLPSRCSHSITFFENIVKPMVLATFFVNVEAALWGKIETSLYYPWESLRSETCLGNNIWLKIFMVIEFGPCPIYAHGSSFLPNPGILLIMMIMISRAEIIMFSKKFTLLTPNMLLSRKFTLLAQKVIFWNSLHFWWFVWYYILLCLLRKTFFSWIRESIFY